MKYVIVGYFRGSKKIGLTQYPTKEDAEKRQKELERRGIKCEVKPISILYN